jgi:hypothetical protein
MPYRQLRLGAGFDLHAFVFYGLLRLLPHPWLRRLVSAPQAAWVRWRRGSVALDALDDAGRAALARLRRDGTAMLPPALSATDLTAIHAHLAACTAVCFTAEGGRSERRVDARSTGVQRARFRVADILTCPQLVRLINDTVALAVAGAALGCRPTVALLGLTWSHASPGRLPDVQHFHRDVESPRFVKVFTYLTDVGPDDGPHRYLAGSHRGAGRLRLRPYDGDALARQLGDGALRTITGPAGTRFIEDTWGVHQGEPVRRGPRLMLDVMYAVGPVALYAYQPQPSPAGVVLDPDVNRLFFQPTAGAPQPAGARPADPAQPPAQPSR